MFATTKRAETERRRTPGSVASVLFDVAVVALIVWQFSGVARGGQQLQVLNPSAPVGWKIVIIGFTALAAVCAAAALVIRRWTIPLAAVNALANIVPAAGVVTLAAREELFSPNLAHDLNAAFGTTSEWNGLEEVVVVVVVALAIWDIVDGFRRARESTPGDR